MTFIVDGVSYPTKAEAEQALGGCEQCRWWIEVMPAGTVMGSRSDCDVCGARR